MMKGRRGRDFFQLVTGSCGGRIELISLGLVLLTLRATCDFLTAEVAEDHAEVAEDFSAFLHSKTSASHLCGKVVFFRSAIQAGISTSYPASIQALVPPVTLSRLVKPACCIKLVAALERKPPAQITATGSVGRKFNCESFSRNVASCALTARGAWPLWYSAGRRTSMTCRLGRVSISSRNSFTLICGTSASSSPASCQAFIPPAR